MKHVQLMDDVHFHDLLMSVLRDLFGDFCEEDLAKLLPRLQTVELSAGDVLMRQGDPSDSMFIVLSGRLRAYIASEEGGSTLIGELGRGDPLGEMGIISGTPRRASIQAIRDCVLVRLAAEDFEEVLVSWPKVALPLARKLLERQARSNQPQVTQRKIVNLCVLPIHDFSGEAGLVTLVCARLRKELERVIACTAKGPGAATGVALYHPTTLPAEFANGRWESSEELHRKLLMWLDTQEQTHAMQVFVADDGDSAWTRLCIRHADQILLLADADGDATPGNIEQRYLTPGNYLSQATQTLLLLHPSSRRAPSGTARWLDARPHIDTLGHSHYHLRRNTDGDWSRVARILSGNAVGLVLAGGGARGFSQLGIMQALEEQGISWDYAGGTSIGAVMAAYAAMDLPSSQVQALARKSFSKNPTGDFNWLPLMSVMRGRRLQRVIRDAVIDVMGGEGGIEDLWKPFFCIASNYSRARADILHKGPLALMLTASVSIPAALPPVLWKGDLLTDGGTFNNYPVDIMRELGAAKVIGVDLRRDRYRPLEFPQMPSAESLLIDRLTRGRKTQRFRGIPSLPTVVFNVAAMASMAHDKRMRELVDLQFNPDVSRVGMLEWEAFNRVLDIGLKHGREMLGAAEAGELLGQLQMAGGSAPKVAVDIAMQKSRQAQSAQAGVEPAAS